MARVQHRGKTTAAYSWSSSDLLEREIGYNTADGTLHAKRADNSIANFVGVVVLTQAAYDALDPPLAKVLYLIEEA